MSEKVSVGLVVIGGLVLGWLILKMVIADDREWEAFRKAHHCHVAGRTDAQWVYGGKGGIVSGQVLWLCDDGQLHGRSE